MGFGSKYSRKIPEEDAPASGNPMDELGGIFASTSIYGPLATIKKRSKKSSCGSEIF
jgi:hypothetical protein